MFFRVIEDKTLLEAWKSRLAKNAVTTTAVRSRRSAARKVQAKLLAAKGPARSLASGREDPNQSITRMNATIRYFHQNAIKRKSNLAVSVHNLENNRMCRLSEEDIRNRITELPVQIQALEDLRDLWRGVSTYASDTKRLPELLHMLDKEELSILDVSPFASLV